MRCFATRAAICPSGSTAIAGPVCAIAAGDIMDHPLRRPEQILAYRSLKQILAAKPAALWTVSPGDSALSAMRLMADKNIGVVVVIENKAIAGILSERDCVRRLVLAGKSPEATQVADIMVRNVVKVDVADTFADCLRLMHQHGIRHLPVTENGAAIGVVSIRDLLSETVAHHARIIGELERERMTMLTSTA
jgi:signal-transduction protein with cAMP-binding, CBS, and nucleotidyltransferase domain